MRRGTIDSMMLRATVVDVNPKDPTRVWVTIPQKYGQKPLRVFTRVQVTKGDHVYVTNTSATRVPQWVVFGQMSEVGSWHTPEPHTHPIGQVDGLKDWLTQYETWMGDHQAKLDEAQKRIAEGKAEVDVARKDLTQAQTDIAEAVRKATLERARLDQAEANLDQMGRNLTAAGGRISANETALAASQKRLDAAETTIQTTKTDLGKVDTRLTTTASDLAGLTTRVGDVSSVADAATRAATDAAAAASAADRKALDAAGLAGSKGRVIYQATAPTGTNADAKNLWIRTTDNKPHTWNGTTWVAVTDKAATDAASAATAAKAAADKAQADATKALADAAAAQRTADQAVQAIADAKIVVDATASDLAKVDTRLTNTAKDLTALQGTVGDVQGTVVESDRKAAAAQEAAKAAQTDSASAMSQYDELRVKLDSALAAKPGLLKDSGFELADQWAPAYGASVIASNVARSGTRVLVLPSENTNTAAGKPVHAYSTQEVQVQEGHQYRLTVYLNSAGDLGDATGNFMIRRGAAGKNAFVAATATTKLAAVGVVRGGWRAFQTDWVAPATYEVQVGVQARDLVSNLYADDFQMVDATAEASLQIAVEDARQKAEAAAEDALAAMRAAGQAQSSADGKTTITATVNAPSGVGVTVGDLHMQLSSLGSGGQIQRQWRWNGSVWVEQKVSGDFVSNLDVGKLTGVFANISQHLKAGSILSDRVVVSSGENLIPDPTFLSDAMNTSRITGTAWRIGTAASGAKVLTTNSTTQSDVPLTGAPDGWMQVDSTAKYQLQMLAAGPDQLSVYLVLLFVDGTSRADGFQWVRPLTGTLAPKIVEWDMAALGGPVAVRPMIRRNPTPSGATNFYTQVGAVSFRRKVGTVLIEDGAVTGDKVEAQTVAAKVGQFVKVQAANVEVTEDLSARVVNAMTANAKNLVVTEDAILNRATVIEGIITPKITVVSKDAADAKTAAQAAQGTADQAKTKVDAVTALESGVTVIDGGKIATGSVKAKSVDAQSVAGAVGQFVKVQAVNVEVTGDLSARVVNAMDTNTKNLVVTESAILQHTTLLGTTVADELNVRKLIRGRDAILSGTVDVAQLNVTGEMSAKIISTATLQARQGFFTDGLTAQDATLLGTTVAEKLVVTDAFSARVVNAMTAQTKQLVVTEDAILNRATVVQSLVTPELITQKADINTLAANMVSAGAIVSRNSTGSVQITPAGITAQDATPGGTYTRRVQLTPAGLVGGTRTTQTVRIDGQNNFMMGTFATAAKEQRVEIKSGGDNAAADFYGSGTTVDHLGVWHTSDGGSTAASRIISQNGMKRIRENPGMIMWPMRGDFAFTGRWARNSDTLKMFSLVNYQGLPGGGWVDLKFTYPVAFPTLYSELIPVMSVESRSGAECTINTRTNDADSITFRVVNKSTNATDVLYVRGFTLNFNTVTYSDMY